MGYTWGGGRMACGIYMGRICMCDIFGEEGIGMWDIHGEEG